MEVPDSLSSPEIDESAFLTRDQRWFGVVGGFCREVAETTRNVIETTRDVMATIRAIIEKVAGGIVNIAKTVPLSNNLVRSTVIFAACAGGAALPADDADGQDGDQAADTDRDDNNDDPDDKLPTLIVEPPSIDFGAATVGREEARATISMLNTGDKPLNITRVIVREDDFTDDMVDELSTSPLAESISYWIIVPYEQREIEVVYVPVNNRADSGEIEILAEADGEQLEAHVRISSTVEGTPRLIVCAHPPSGQQFPGDCTNPAELAFYDLEFDRPFSSEEVEVVWRTLELSNGGTGNMAIMILEPPVFDVLPGYESLFDFEAAVADSSGETVVTDDDYPVTLYTLGDGFAPNSIRFFVSFTPKLAGEMPEFGEEDEQFLRVDGDDGLDETVEDVAIGIHGSVRCPEDDTNGDGEVDATLHGPTCDCSCSILPPYECTSSDGEECEPE